MCKSPTSLDSISASIKWGKCCWVPHQDVVRIKWKCMWLSGLSEPHFLYCTHYLYYTSPSEKLPLTLNYFYFSTFGDSEVIAWVRIYLGIVNTWRQWGLVTATSFTRLVPKLRVKCGRRESRIGRISQRRVSSSPELMTGVPRPTFQETSGLRQKGLFPIS